MNMNNDEVRLTSMSEVSTYYDGASRVNVEFAFVYYLPMNSCK